MALKQALRPTNRRIRLLVGILLVGLFCIQGRTTEAFRKITRAREIDGETLGQTDASERVRIRELADTDHIALLEECLAHVRSSYRDYTCTLTKYERINGRKGRPQKIDVKFLAKPYSVAMKWVENPPRGDRVLYVDGKYNNMMLVRPTSRFLRALVPTARRQPDGPEAMGSTLRPVNQFGFERGLESLLEVYKDARQRGELKKFSCLGYYEVAGRKTIGLVRYLPAASRYPAWKTVIYIDLEYLVPISIEGYDWDGELFCQYVYEDIQFNVGLTANDFLPEANDLRAD